MTRLSIAKFRAGLLGLLLGAVPVLVVQGREDPFGMPRSSGTRKVVRVPGNHTLRVEAAGYLAQRVVEVPP